MKRKDSPTVESSNVTSSINEDVDRHWDHVVKRRAFLQGIGIASAGAILPAGALLMTAGKAQAKSKGKLSSGDAAILRFLAAAELIESDLWTQYAELGGVAATTADEEFQGFTTGNTPYTLALQNLDGDMPQYITDNTDDELSHAAFLNAYLMSRGAKPVSLKKFERLEGSRATGSSGKMRITNLKNLNVDLSWYTRYRSNRNPDLGEMFQGPFVIQGQPAIPLDDTDTPPSTNPTVPITGRDNERIQAIANTAGFHFAFIEQGGSSLYNAMSQKCSDLEVLRIVVSIGGVEVDHFSLWHDKAGNAVNTPLAGVIDPVTNLTFPNLNNNTGAALELTQTNKILPEPCQFISQDLPNCSVIRPSSQKNAGAVAAVNSLIEDNLFDGQGEDFIDFVMQLAKDADAAHREF